MEKPALSDLTPAELAILFAYGRLVVLLDNRGLVSADEVASDLRDHAHEVPEEAAGLLLNIAHSFRSAGSNAAEVQSSATGSPAEEQVGG